MRLCKRYELLPRMLYVKNVACPDKIDPAFRGGYADIFRGTLKGRAVALKRLRTYALQPVDRDIMHDVKFPSF
jgi:hypothetical protein